MSERPPLNAPITQLDGSHPSRVMSRWMQDASRRLDGLEGPRLSVDGGTPSDRPTGRTFLDGGAPDSTYSVFHHLDGGGPNA